MNEGAALHFGGKSKDRKGGPTGQLGTSEITQARCPAVPPSGARRPVKNYYYFGPWCVLPLVATILPLS